jgi:hypothetical protein
VRAPKGVGKRRRLWFAGEGKLISRRGKNVTYDHPTLDFGEMSLEIRLEVACGKG